MGIAIRSPLSLLCCSVGSPSLFSLSSYGRSWIFGTILVAALWILSIFLISFLLCGDHIVAAYSSLGRIIYSINFFIMSSSMYVNALFIFLSSSYVALTILFTCFSGDRLSLIVIPRSFSSLVFLISTSPMVYCFVCLLLLFPSSITLHLVALNSISHLLLHSYTLSRSFCSISQSVLFSTLFNNFASSANKLM